MYRALYFSPMVPSYNVAETVCWFIDALGFEPVLSTAGYAVLLRDDKTVHIQNAGPDIGEMACYLEVNDLDEVWSLMQGHLDGLRVREPFNQDYGMRELHVEVPHTKTLLFIGAEIPRG